VRDFASFFACACGHQPYGFQARIARDGLPSAVIAPTGSGKTAVILAWLWRLLYGPAPAATPRRLVYALPPGALAEPLTREVRRWLANLELTEHVALHVAMGARAETSGDWRENMHRPAIVVGSADVLVSKALNRGFGTGRALLPIDFALVVNGAHWILDEAWLCPQTAATLRRLEALAGEFGTAEPFGLTLLTTAMPRGSPETAHGPTVEVDREDLVGELSARLGAVRTIRRMPADPGDYEALAAAVSRLHRPGTLTLVTLNTVAAAQRVYRQLRGWPAGRTLLHPRFRGIERVQRLADIAAGASRAGRIVVSAQVAEAGIDVSAAVLVAEAAPWPTVVLRSGRCNRSGVEADAEFWWLPPDSPAPYERKDIDAASAELDGLEGIAVSADDLAGRDVFSTTQEPATIGREAFTGLFDTSVDVSRADLDIGPYLRDAADLDAEVAWATWTPRAEGAPDPDIRLPAAEYRCRVALGDVIELAEGRAVWRFDTVDGQWARVTAEPRSRLRAGELLLVDAADGGYDAETGFDPSARAPVPDSPELLTPEELAVRAVQAEPDDIPGAEDDGVPVTAAIAPRVWQSLDAHSEQVRDQAAALFAVLAPDFPQTVGQAVAVAGYLHDVGKAHPIWQDALCALAEDQERDEIAAGRPWAKSGGKGGALHFAGGVSFRHELASLLLADGPLRDLLAAAPDQDLARYLILAHHGRLRVQVREPVKELAVPACGQGSGDKLLGLEQGAISDIPPTLGHQATTFTVDLGQFRPGAARPWTGAVLGLRDTYGPFALAYLETVVRVADWRASGGRELPG
jgi:CRISPR-associated endonuclease/helicase Cas3